MGRICHFCEMEGSAFLKGVSLKLTVKSQSKSQEGFHENWWADPKTYMETHRAENSQGTLEEEWRKSGSVHQVPRLDCCSAGVTGGSVAVPQRVDEIDSWRRVPDRTVFAQTLHQWLKIPSPCLLNSPETITYQHRHSTPKFTTHARIHSKWIQDLSVKDKRIKCPEDTIG